MALLDLLAEAGEPDAQPLDEDLLGAVARAYAARARGRSALASDPAAARQALEDALARFVAGGLAYESARTRLVLARASTDTDRESAVSDARIALSAFDQLGAAREADAAGALLRTLGERAARAAPRGLPLLTRREREVLGLLGEGLSNPAISERLFLSRRTVEHHVSSVLRKLGLSSRAEAAALATRIAREVSVQK